MIFIKEKKITFHKNHGKLQNVDVVWGSFYQAIFGQKTKLKNFRVGMIYIIADLDPEKYFYYNSFSDLKYDFQEYCFWLQFQFYQSRNRSLDSLTDL